jgi:hypothetical protein
MECKCFISIDCIAARPRRGVKNERRLVIPERLLSIEELHKTARQGAQKGLTPIQIFTILILCFGAFSPIVDVARALPQPRECRSVPLTGEVKEGQEWSVAIGEGWIFRLVPIQPSGRGYSGWDLVVNRVEDGGYPDALLVGTPPYGSLNEREIGTTYGLRAQDAIAWNPRRFHFLTSAKSWQRARELFREVVSNPSGEGAGAATRELLGMVSDPSQSVRGQFSLLDARLIPGAGDPPAYARQWAANLSQVPHTIEQTEQTGGSPSAQGELRWIRFAVTLWLPESWKTSSELRNRETKCAE